jgi:hypothetical protein
MELIQMKNTKQQTINEAAANYKVQYVDYDFEQMRGRCSVRYCAAKKFNRTVIGEYLDSDDISIDSCKFQIKLNKKEQRVEITVWERDQDVNEKLWKGFESFDGLYRECNHSDESANSFGDINMFALIRNVLDIDYGCTIPNCDIELYFDPTNINYGEKDHEYWINFDDLLAVDCDDRGCLGLIESILANK